MLALHKLERVTKGVANKRRVEILLLIDKKPDLSLIDIARTLKYNIKTANDHLNRLYRGGLIMKRRRSYSMQHALSERGRSILSFLRKLE